jgi:uncharacterized protein
VGQYNGGLSEFISMRLGSKWELAIIILGGAAILVPALKMSCAMRQAGKPAGSAADANTVARGANDAMSIDVLRSKAEQGDINSQDRLGFAYTTGRGVAQDYSEAMKWYRKAAEGGLADAQYNLGLMYSKGEGVAQDSNEAVKWYGKAAGQGFAPAQYNLGLKYANGDGVARDYKEAVKLYTEAAEQGYAAAQYNLATMYVAGRGVTEDYVQGYKWMLLAAKGGSTMATAKKDVLRERMSPEQVAQAEILAGEFVTNEKSR